MASTPSSRPKLTPSNSPFLQRPSRSPFRARTSPHESRLSLKRVIGTTCSSPTGFDTVLSSFAYIAGGAVVVVDLQGEHYSQRFFRARPTAVPLYAPTPTPASGSTPKSTPKANDSRNRAALSPRDSSYYSPHDSSDSPLSRTWTSRERIKAATCLALSRDGRYLAVGETGYAPRVLIFSLQDSSSDIPLVSISEHTFGVRAVAWSPDTKYLASLGAANDGYLYLWKIDSRTGAAKLFQQNKCTSHVRGMIWVGNNLLTLGVRHVKIWKVEEPSHNTSPTKSRFAGDGSFPSPQAQQLKALPGRNILLGSLLDTAFTCAAALDENRAVICSETGDVCLLDYTQRQMKLSKVVDLELAINCVSIRQQNIYIGGKSGQFAVLSVDAVLEGRPDPVLKSIKSSNGLIAMGFLTDNLVTINAQRSIDIWSPDHTPQDDATDAAHIPIPGHGDPVVGIHQLTDMGEFQASFFTWSGSGKVTLWDADGKAKSTFDVALEQVEENREQEPSNQLLVLKATRGGQHFISGDKFGLVRFLDIAGTETQAEIKAHCSSCEDIAVFQGDNRILLATSGRDRTVQLFSKSIDGKFELFQTLEFAARVVQALIPSENKVIVSSMDRSLQIHDLVSKDDDREVMAAIPAKLISLKASPSSIAMASHGRSILVSLLDRTVCQYDVGFGRLLNSFRCVDEGGNEAVVLDSLILGETSSSASSFLLGISNTDKSVRMYDPQSGAFIDREWGHTEAINGAILLDGSEAVRKVVSVGSDGTIMIWALDLQEAGAGSPSRDQSPEKGSFSASHRPPLRRVLSKADLADFQRPSSSTPTGRRSPQRTLSRRSSRFSLASPTLSRNPLAAALASPACAIAEDTATPSRRSSSGSSGSPPESPKSRLGLRRRPSLPVLNTTPPAYNSNAAAAKRKSTVNLRASYGGAGGFGSLSMATEQTCRQLRAYRKKLISATPVDPIFEPDGLAELENELRMTSAALVRARERVGCGEERRRYNHKDSNKSGSDTMLNGLLDQYSERLVTMLDEKLRLRLDEELPREAKAEPSAETALRDLGDKVGEVTKERPRTAGEDSNSSSITLAGEGSGSG